MFDAFRRINAKDFNKKSVESLARAGAFDCVAERNNVLVNTDALLEFNRALHRKTDAGQKNLFAGDASAPLPEARITLTQATPASSQERLAWEKELLGLYVSEHPLQDFRTILDRIASPISSVLGGADQAKVRIAGVISRIKKIITKSGQPMLFVIVEDLSHSMEVLVFPKMLAQDPDKWIDGGMVIVDGTLSDKDGETKLLANAVRPLTKEAAAQEKTISSHTQKQNSLAITLPRSISRDTLEALHEALKALHADTNTISVSLAIRNGAASSTISTPYRITSDESALAKLATIVGSESIRLAAHV